MACREKKPETSSLREVTPDAPPSPPTPHHRPSSLDAYVFGHLAPVLRCRLPGGKLQLHLKSLENLSSFCSNILQLYFPSEGRGQDIFSHFVFDFPCCLLHLHLLLHHNSVASFVGFAV